MIYENYHDQNLLPGPQKPRPIRRAFKWACTVVFLVAAAKIAITLRSTPIEVTSYCLHNLPWYATQAQFEECVSSHPLNR